jgi:hypothetical protein
MDNSNISPAFTIDEVVDNFNALLEQTDFEQELAMSGIKRMRFVTRRRMKAEWLAIYIALWRLALDRSFPADGDAIFKTFIEHRIGKIKQARKAELFISHIMEYVEMFRLKGNNDFSLPAEHLTAKLMLSEQEAQSVRMKMILRLRELYKLIFDRLI